MPTRSDSTMDPRKILFDLWTAPLPIKYPGEPRVSGRRRRPKKQATTRKLGSKTQGMGRRRGKSIKQKYGVHHTVHSLRVRLKKLHCCVGERSRSRADSGLQKVQKCRNESLSQRYCLLSCFASPFSCLFLVFFCACTKSPLCHPDGQRCTLVGSPKLGPALVLKCLQGQREAVQANGSALLLP